MHVSLLINYYNLIQKCSTESFKRQHILNVKITNDTQKPILVHIIQGGYSQYLVIH